MSVVAKNSTYDYEVEPCKRDPEQPSGDGRETVVCCAAEEAEFWGVYRRPSQLQSDAPARAEWLSDHPTHSKAVVAAIGHALDLS